MKRKVFIVISIIILGLGCKDNRKQTVPEAEPKNELPTTDNKEQLIYREITEVEKYKGFTKVVGMVLDGTDYALSYIRKDSVHVLVLQQIIRDNPSKVNYRILDEVRLIANPSKLFSEPTECKLINKPDENFVFGFARDQDKEYFDIDHILKVWKVNLHEKKFREIDPEKVECYNPWFNYDI